VAGVDDDQQVSTLLANAVDPTTDVVVLDGVFDFANRITPRADVAQPD
jgi:hypothetical protein